MNKQIQLYYKNALADVVGTEHGLSPAELAQVESDIARITEQMAQDRAEGKLPYRDLPYRNEMCRQVQKLIGELAGKYDNLVVLGIGGSALGNIALQTALNDPLYNLWPDRPGPRLFVMDNVDPVQFAALLEYIDDQLDRTIFNIISYILHYITRCNTSRFNHLSICFYLS